MNGSRLFLLFWLLLCLLPGAEAKQMHKLPRRPVLPVYRLMPLPIRDANPPQCVWLLEEARYGSPFTYKSLQAPGLLFWLSTLPKGTQIQYSAASYPIQGLHNEEVLPFAHRCREKGIVFSYQSVL